MRLDRPSNPNKVLVHMPSHSSATRALAVAMGITASFFVIELVGGILTNSLALQTDAFHMLTDVVALAYALLAAWLAQRPVSLKRTYGYYRVEILSAFLNGILLWAVVIFVIWYFTFTQSNKITKEAFDKHRELSEHLIQLLKDEQDYKLQLSGILDRVSVKLDTPAQCPILISKKISIEVKE